MMDETVGGKKGGVGAWLRNRGSGYSSAHPLDGVFLFRALPLCQRLS